MDIQEKIKLIHSYLGISTIEKKQAGEVFTSFKLIDEMFDKIPLDIWKNPNLKWLDAANGIGNFPAKILERLMISLESWEKDEEKRYKHIMEKMIYVCDIQPKNNFIFMKLFEKFKNTKVKLNIYPGSFLDEKFDRYMKEVWKLKYFDNGVINPPYNSPTGDVGQSKFYMFFVKKNLKILKENGLLLCISPPKALNEILDYQIIYASFNTNKFFPNIGARISDYLIRKTTYMENTQIYIDDEIFETKLNSVPLIPFGLMKEKSFEILHKIYKQETKRFFKFKRDDKNPDPESVFTRRVNRTNGFFHAEIFNEDPEKKLSQDYTSQTDPENLKFLLNSKLFSFLFVANSVSPYITQHFLNKIPFPEQQWKEMSDGEIYKFYNLTENEIKFIEKTVCI